MSDRRYGALLKRVRANACAAEQILRRHPVRAGTTV